MNRRQNKVILKPGIPRQTPAVNLHTPPSSNSLQFCHPLSKIRESSLLKRYTLSFEPPRGEKKLKLQSCGVIMDENGKRGEGRDGRKSIDGLICIQFSERENPISVGWVKVAGVYLMDRVIGR